MDPTSLQFVFITLGACVTFFIMPIRPWRRFIFPLVNLGFIYFCSPNPVSLLPFLIFIIFGYVCLKCIEKTRSKGFLIAYLFLTVTVFIYLKQYPFFGFLPALNFSYSTIGLSYVLFRIIHLSVDVQESNVKNRVLVVDYFNYTCSFLAFLSGPIQRYQQYREQFENPWNGNIIDRKEAINAIVRFLKGYFKIITLSSSFFYFHEHYLGLLNGEALSPWIFMLCSLFYFLYLFFNFSGYMDVVISLAFFVGFKLPENFNRPYLARNLIEFWARWHMTLSEWFKIYVFNTIVRKLAKFWPKNRMLPWYGVFAYFVTFFLIGIWHSSSLAGILMGILLAVGVSVNKCYEFTLARFAKKKTIANFHANKLIAQFSVGLTLSYISLSLCTLWLDMNGIKFIYSVLTWKGIIQAYLISSVLIMILKIIFEYILAIMEAAKILILKDRASLSARFTMAKIIILVYIIGTSFMVILRDVPNLVYKGF